MKVKFWLRQFVILPSLFVAAQLSLGAVQDQNISAEDIFTLATEEKSREWVTEKTGEILPLETAFADENGQQVTLGELIDKPTLILPIYFYCPSSCSVNLANMAVAMNRLKFDPGQDYKAIALSFSDTETPDNARRAKNNYTKLLYDNFPQDQWTFLTGSSESINAVTEALGYRFKRMPDHTFLHPSTMIAVDEEGKIIRYIYGKFIPGDIDIAISNAQQGIPTLSVKRFLEFCLDYDPDKNKSVFQIVKIAVILFFTVAISIFLFLAGRKRRNNRKA